MKRTVKLHKKTTDFKNGQRFEQILHQRRNTDGKWTHEKILNIMSLGNGN